MTDPLTALLRYPLFAALDRASVAKWWSAAPIRRYATGEMLAHRDELANEMFLVGTGRVRVLYTTEDREIGLGMCPRGALVGDHTLLPPGTYRASVRAAADSSVRLLPIAPIRQLLADAGVAPGLRAWVRLHFAVRCLRDESYLGFMSPHSFLPLLDRCSEVSVRRGCAIQAAGLADDSLFLIRTGQVVWVPDRPTEVCPPTVLGPDDVFGAETLAGTVVSHTAVATEDATLVRVTRDAFLDQPSGDTDSQTFTQVGGAAISAEYPWVGQERAEECGLAALTMAARAHGRHVTTAELRRHFAFNAWGVSIANIVSAACAIGLRATAVRLGADQLAGLVLPVVAHLTGGHFVVVFAVTSESLTVGDPARGVVRLSRPSFLRTWSGTAVLLGCAN